MWGLSDNKVNNFVKKKMQWYSREINYENIYIKNVENKEIVKPLTWKIHDVFWRIFWLILYEFIIFYRNYMLHRPSIQYLNVDNKTKIPSNIIYQKHQEMTY